MEDKKKKIEELKLKPKFANVDEFLRDPRLTRILEEAQGSGLRILINVCGEPLNSVWEDLFNNKFGMLSVAPPQSLRITAIANLLLHLEQESGMPREVALAYIAILGNNRKIVEHEH